MVVKFVIPVVDTEKGKYESGRDFSTNEYLRMLNDKVQRNEQIMREFEYNYQNGLSIRGNYSGIYDAQNVDTNKEIEFNFSPAQALLQDGNGNNIEMDYLETYVNSGKKFLLKVNINPNSLEEDAESEIRAWLDDSSRVLNDRSLDNKTMLLSLPLRDFIVDMDEDGKPIYQLLGCKVLQIYPEETSKFRYYFAIMVEKIMVQK